MRAVSTVLDVAVFLLLVSVALATLAVPAADPPASTADETIEALAATTGNVSYTPGGSDGGHLEPTRTASGTHAELLARGAVANLRLGNASLTPTTDRFRATIREETAIVLSWSSDRTGVRATWEPYPGSPLRGEFAVGKRPPRRVDVATATIDVPVPIEDARPAAMDAASDGYRGVARVIVNRSLQPILVADRHEPRVLGGYALRDRNRRIRAYAAAVNVGEPPEGWEAALPAIERRIVDRLAADMRERYETPGAAAAAVRTGRVHVDVREWST